MAKLENLHMAIKISNYKELNKAARAAKKLSTALEKMNKEMTRMIAILDSFQGTKIRMVEKGLIRKKENEDG